MKKLLFFGLAFFVFGMTDVSAVCLRCQSHVQNRYVWTWTTKMVKNFRGLPDSGHIAERSEVRLSSPRKISR
jgi:hypothetical protein